MTQMNTLTRGCVVLGLACRVYSVVKNIQLKLCYSWIVWFFSGSLLLMCVCASVLQSQGISSGQWSSVGCLKMFVLGAMEHGTCRCGMLTKSSW